MEKPSMEKLSVTASTINGDEEVEGMMMSRRDVVVSEVKRQLWLAGPLIAGNLLQNILQVISVMFVGHLGELALSGASMATSFACVTGYSFMLGMSSALDTLCGQTFGAKRYNMLGIQMQRAMLVLMMVAIPLAFVWAFTAPILLLFGQKLEIATEAGIFARWMIPSLFAYGLLQCHVKFLQNQNIVLPIMITSGITAIFHILFCWLLVYKMGLSSKGAAVALCISYWLNVIILYLYIKLSPLCKLTWIGFSKEALHDIMSFVKLAIPSVAMVCLEMWSFELIVLLSGLLPNPKLQTSTLSICLNTASLVFMLPFGLGSAVSTRVSNELGAGRPRAVVLAIKVVICLVVAEGLLVGTLIILIRSIWGHAYSNDEEVVKYVAALLPILAVSNFFDGIQTVLSGVARGCGWQEIGTYVNLGSYYLIGIPSAILLAFVLRIGGKGLWMGIVCGIVVQVTLFSAITIFCNWEKEVVKAKERVLKAETEAIVV